jgi:hypothetical protein
VFVLGISLVTKHVFFIFPLWLAFKQKGLFQKALILFVPYSVFLLSFVPYWNEGKEGIIQNVFLYSSRGNDIFYKLFFPLNINLMYPSIVVWIVLLAIFAVYFQKKDAFTSLLYYTCILVAASPSITNQYLSIVVAFISVEFNLIFLLYTIIGTLYLFSSSAGFQFLGLPDNDVYSALVLLLSLGVVWQLWRQRLLEIYKWVLAFVSTKWDEGKK